MGFIKTLTRGKAWFLWILLIMAGVNWAAATWHARIDLTNEKRFTLSNATKKLLRGLEQPVQVDVFLTGNLPSAFKKLSSTTDDLLREFREIAGNRIAYRFLSPDEQVPGSSVTYADTLSAMGMFPLNLTTQLKEGQQQQFVYPVAIVHYGTKELPVRLYQGRTPMVSYQELNSAEALLEFTLADAVARISRKEKPIIGYATGNGEPESYETYDLVENALKPDYRFYTFNLQSQPDIPPACRVLMLVKPSMRFSDEEKLKLDQYVMRGGKLLIFIDRLNAEMDSLRIKNEVVAYDRDLQLNDLLFKYGVRVNPDLLMDLQCDYLPFDVNGNGQYEFLPWNYFPVMQSSDNHPINRNLGFISGRFVNSIDTVEAEGIRKTILLHSSNNARLISSPALISGRENVNAPEDEKFKKSRIPVAVLLEGKFQSLYTNRLPQVMRDSLARTSGGFQTVCPADNRMIVVGDGDMVLNSVVKGNQPIEMGMNPFTFGTQREFPFANRTFLLNCLDYLVNEEGLSEAKSKDYVTRLLDPVKVNEQKQQWQLINIAAPLLLVVMFAGLFQWLRRRKYNRKMEEN